MSLSEGQIIEGKYKITRLLGEGGMGAVYEGENERIRRKVAIKVLHSGVAENTDAVKRFQREAQAAGQIGSDHIVEVLDMGRLPDGEYFMVMEYLFGDSLGQRLDRVNRLAPHVLAPIAMELLDGLGAAHAAGIIHRDLKPDNVWLLTSKAGRPDFVKILDFGISKFNVLNGEEMSMTRTGAVMGTPYYMAPEQAKGGRDLDCRADLYSVGVILYEASTGALPFQADTFNELLFKIVLEPLKHPIQLVPDMDPGFAAIIVKAMAREPAERYPTAQAFAQAIADWAGLDHGAGPPRPTFVSQATAPGQVGPAAGPSDGRGGMYDTRTPAPFSSSGAPAAQNTPPPKKKSAGPLLLGGVAIALLLVGLGATLALRRSSTEVADAKPATPVDPPKAEPPKPAEPPPVAPPAATSEAKVAPPSPSASVDPAADAKHDKGKGGPQPGVPAKDTPAQTKGGRVFRDKI